MENKNISIDSKVVHGKSGYDPNTGAVSFPIYQSATFRHPALNETTGYDYSRLQNPTRQELEETMAMLEGGENGFAFSSGLAALSAVMELFGSGDHIIVSDDIYGGTYRLFDTVCSNHGLTFSYVDTTDINQIEKSIKKNTAAIFIETPTNPMMKISDIKEISNFAKPKNITLIIDNTFMSPYFQKPLMLGADIVVHSATKLLGGHNDTLAGIVITKDSTFKDRLDIIKKSTGAVLSPFDSWLILRGIKTLGIRLTKQEENSKMIVEWLDKNSKISKVYYPGQESHKGYEIQKKQCTGFGSIISFEVKDVNLIPKILKNIRLILFAESLGGVESLITYPIVQTHNAIPENLREKQGVNERLLRLSVGIENPIDLIEDLEFSMK